MVVTVTDTTIALLKNPMIVGSFTFLMILALATLFIVRELFSGAHHATGHALRQLLRIGIVPLLLIFLLFVGLKISEISR